MPEEFEEEVEEQDLDDFGEDEDGYRKRMPYESWAEKYGMERD